MPQIYLSDDAKATLASSINNSATSLSVAAGKGALFPAVVAGSGDYFRITLENAAGVKERIKVTEHAAGNDSFATIVRGEEGTTAVSWNAGDIVALRGTAAVFEEIAIQTNPRPQCILVLASTGNIRLDPFQGRHIPLYSSGRWRLRRVPAAGVALATGGLAGGVTRYVYAYWTGTAIALEISSTGFSADDLTGLPYKTGDITKLLVGALIGNDASAVDCTGRTWGVSSYWGRMPRRLFTSNSGTQVLTGNLTWNTTPGLSQIVVWGWGDDALDVTAMLSGTFGGSFVLIPMFGHSSASPYAPRYAEDGNGAAGTAAGTLHARTPALVGVNAVNPLYYSNANCSVGDGRASLEVQFLA